MRFTVIITAFLTAATAIFGVSAVPAPAAEANNTVSTAAVTVNNFNVETFEPHLIASNFYGAPIPPWRIGYHPGWYYGDHFDIAKRFGFGFVFPYLKDVFACKLFDLIPFIFHCPGYKFPPFHPRPLPPHFPHHHGFGWGEVFGGLDGAIVGGDYLSYGLVDTIEDCQTVCTYIDGCVFINAYRDVFGRDGSPLLSCTLFSSIQTREAATFTGGLTLPGGSVNVIRDSVGYYRY